jgi:hypothetical protein
VHSPAGHRLPASWSDPSGLFRVETFGNSLGDSVSFRVPSRYSLGGSPLLRQGRRWPAGACKAKRSLRLLDPTEGLADNSRGNRRCYLGMFSGEQRKVDDADCRQNGSQSGDAHQSCQRHEEVCQASVLGRSHCSDLSGISSKHSGRSTRFQVGSNEIPWRCVWAVKRRRTGA